MKNQNTSTRLPSASRLFLLQGFILVIGLFFQSCNYSTAYKYLEQEKVFKDKKYESDKLFKMRQGTIQAPLMSQKGHYNLNFDFINGYGATFSSAISDKIYIQAGTNFLKSKNTSSKTTNILVEENSLSNEGIPNTIENEYRVDYDLKLVLTNYSFFASIGKYKVFGQHGRFEYCGGMAYGNASNVYSYDFYSNSNYSFKETRKYFQYYIQSDFGYVTKKSEGALILRASNFNFLDQKFDMDYPLNEYTMKNNQLVLQPSVKFGFGGNFRAYMQCGWNVPLGNSQLQWFSTNVQAGILFRIHDKPRKSILN